MQEVVPPTALPSRDEKRSYVRGMFTAIAPRYDFLNHLLSLNVDRWWRRRAVRRLRWDRVPDGTYLDSCAGTLDLAAELARRNGFRGRVVGADFVVPMLRLGRTKTARVMPVGADALVLPFGDQSFEGATVGFGVRNLVDLRDGLAELRRVLKPGGRAVILEFTTPTAWPIRPLYLFYFRHLLPLIGKIVSKHRDAYSYLPNSVLSFPEPSDLAGLMRDVGFGAVGYECLTFGIVAVHWGEA
ncbi:MAG TPA: ubiquinone/menaquinone biosynthesis methyltransferase [Gemmatimonadales bacterium]